MKTVNQSPIEHPKFVLASIRERILFNNFLNQRKDFEIKNTSPITGYDKWDVVIKSANTPYVIEIKIRDKSMFMYEEWFLEEIKFSSLTGITSSSRAKELGTKAYYLNIFQDGVLMWEISNELAPKFTVVYMKKTTAVQSEAIGKRVTHMSRKSATIYSFTNDIYKANKESKDQFRKLLPNTECPNFGIW